jgi:hypothetical protein
MQQNPHFKWFRRASKKKQNDVMYNFLYNIKLYLCDIVI